ncbi:CRAL/TRIO domain protein, partial [Toxoplasma gondii ARI]
WGYVYSHDRLGRPCLVLRLGNLSLTSSSPSSSPSALSSSASPAGSSGESDWKLAFVFLVEEALKSMGRDVEQLVVLLDARNVSFKNFPVPEILQMQVILQAFYPERLGIVLVVNANWQAKLLWLSLRAQLSGSTRSKIFFLPSEPKKLREFLLTFFEESRLPKWCLQCFS